MQEKNILISAFHSNRATRFRFFVKHIKYIFFHIQNTHRQMHRQAGKQSTYISLDPEVFCVMKTKYLFKHSLHMLEDQRYNPSSVNSINFHLAERPNIITI